MTRGHRRAWIIGAAVAVVAIAVAAGLRWNEPFVAALLDSQQRVESLVERFPVLSLLAYVLVVCLGKVTPVPGGIVLILTGGYFFGTVPGGVAAAVGAALSAGLVAAAGRAFLSEHVERLAGDRLRALESATVRDGFFYLLAARLLPVAPAWLVNLVPVVAPIPMRVVVSATFIGLLPLSVTIASVGHGISHLAQLDQVSVADLDARLLLPFTALALLALLPVAVRRLRSRRN